MALVAAQTPAAVPTVLASEIDGPCAVAPSMTKGKSCCAWCRCQCRSSKAAPPGRLQAIRAGLGSLAQDRDGRRPWAGGQRAAGLPVEPVGAGRQDGVDGDHIGHDRASVASQGRVQHAVDVGEAAAGQAVGGGVAEDDAAATCAGHAVPDPQVDVVDRGGGRRPGLVGVEGDRADVPAACRYGEVVGHAEARGDGVAEAVEC